MVDCLRCKVMLKAVMAAPRPRAILDALEKGGVGILENAPENQTRSPDTLNITCKACPDEGTIKTARAYMEAPPTSVILCADRLKDKAEMEEVLVHELVHVFDHTLGKKDLTLCNDLAYSEVRAAREADCHYSSHVCSWFKKQCVKDAAVRCTSTLFPEHGRACVDRIFEQAYRDTAPLSTPTTAAAAAAPSPTPQQAPPMGAGNAALSSFMASISSSAKASASRSTGASTTSA